MLAINGDQIIYIPSITIANEYALRDYTLLNAADALYKLRWKFKMICVTNITKCKIEW